MGLKELERFAVQMKGLCDFCQEKAVIRITVTDNSLEKDRKETLTYLSCPKHITKSIKDLVRDWLPETQ